MADIELAEALPQLGVFGTLPAVEMTTSGTPQSYDGTPAVVAITVGGTEEEIDLALPELPVGGWFNPYIIGQRVIFCLVGMAGPGDSVVITAGGSGAIRYYPQNQASGVRGVLNGVVLDSLGYAVCFVWCGDAWCIDYALTNQNFSGDNDDVSVALQTFGAGHAATIAGAYASLQTQSGAAADDPGGDFTVSLGVGSGSGRQGAFIINPPLPDANLMVDGSFYYDPITFVVKYNPPA